MSLKKIKIGADLWLRIFSSMDYLRPASNESG